MQCYKVNVQDVPVISDREGNLRILISPRQCDTQHMVVGHSTVPPHKFVTKHIHDYSDEAFYVIKGSGLLVTENETLVFSQGDSVHIPKGSVHTIQNPNDFDLEVIFFVTPLAPKPELGHRELID